MQVINYTPCALNSTGIGTDATFNTDGAVAPAQLKALFDAAKTGGKIDGHDIYTAQLISADSATAILAGNGYVNDFIPANEGLRQAYVHASYINGASVVDGKVSAGGTQTVLQVTATLLPADVKSLFATPYVLVPAPGVGSVLVPLQMTFIVRNVGLVAYTRGAGSGAEGPQLCFGGNFAISPFNAIFHAMLTTAATNQMDVFTSPLEWGAGLLASFENQPLTLAGTGTEEYAVGTGAVEVSLSYLKITI